jgi:cryptochrome
VRQAAEEAGVEVHSPVSHTLYDPELLLSRSGGKPPLTMQSFTKLVTAGGPFVELSTFDSAALVSLL